ncbi:CAP domain-containing protein [Oceanobacillus sp. CAU 1775]
MFQKLLIITASSFALTYGGVFSSAAETVSVDAKQLAHKAFYTLSDSWNNLSDEDISNQLKLALEKLEKEWQVNIDEDEVTKEVVQEVTELEEKKQEATNNPVPSKEQPKQNQETVNKEAQAKAQAEAKAKAEAERKAKQEAEAKAEADRKAQEKAEAERKAKEQAAAQAQQQQKQQEKPKQQTAPSNALSQFEQQVVDLTNQERAKAGLKPLQADTSLSGVAREKSRDMAVNNYFAHQSPTYGSPFDMMKKYGISYNAAGENIAKGQTSPQQVVTAWMNSAGHRANILNGNFTHIGVGYVSQGNHWTQMFISK